MEKVKKEAAKRISEAAKEKFIKDTADNLKQEEFTDDDFIIEEAANVDIKVWYYIDQGEVRGAFTKEEMLAKYQDGTLKETTEVWNNTMSDWMELGHTVLYEKKRPKRTEGLRAKKIKRKHPYLPIVCVFGAIILILCAVYYFVGIKAKSEAEKDTIIGTTASTNDTGDVNGNGVTIKKIVEKYMTDSKYDLQAQDNQESLLTVTGTLKIEGTAQAANFKFRVKSDGSVHFEQLSINGEVQTASVYQKLIDEMQED